jgi:23S rRNA (adenine2030-N6)-methyltransferase
MPPTSLGMNYRHAFHAGNFADVLKHIVLVACLTHLARKPAPFRVIDTHAGCGSYDLAAGKALRTGEWRDGIGRLARDAPSEIPAAGRALLERYLTIVAGDEKTWPPARYPGSPAIALAMLRKDDRLVANELHPADNATLRETISDRRVKVLALDGWTAIKSLLPPRERRGLVLIDPPFEEPGELIRLTNGLTAALDRFAGGTYLLWYPVKDMKPVARFQRAMRELAAARKLESMLAAQVLLRAPRNPDLLNGCGLVIANPPYTLAKELGALLPWLAEKLAQGPGAIGTIEELVMTNSAAGGAPNT